MCILVICIYYINYKIIYYISYEITYYIINIESLTIYNIHKQYSNTIVQYSNNIYGTIFYGWLIAVQRMPFRFGSFDVTDNYCLIIFCGAWHFFSQMICTRHTQNISKDVWQHIITRSQCYSDILPNIFGIYLLIFLIGINYNVYLLF